MSALEDHDLSVRADALKDAGNALYNAKQFEEAAAQYSAAIELRPSAVLFSNRAQAYLSLEDFGLVIDDANSAIALDPTAYKAYLRRGSAHVFLRKYKDARKDFKAVLQLMPSQKTAKEKLAAVEKLIREEAFIKAIETEETGRGPKSYNVEDMVVEASYSGPRLPVDGAVSVEFVLGMMQEFKEQRGIPKKYVLQMLLAARALFGSLSSLLNLSLPEGATSSEDPSGPHFNVCGDTHGQYYDLCNIFEIGGLPSSTNPYLFNGDYVDRGSFSFEVALTLIAWKLADRSCMNMLRGNHESKNMNRMYGFEGEVKHKYDENVMNLFSEVFNLLPIAAVIQNKVFVVHGGLSTDESVMLSDIAAIPRGREIPESGLMSDLLWADPQFQPGRRPSKRGVGFSFGPDITSNFLSRNNLELLVRSHEVKHDGYEVDHDGKCITIFSAPNYCDQMGNSGAFIRFYSDMKPNFQKFSAVPHPNVPPMRYANSMMSQFF